jgi:hypothetical protein
LAGRVKAHTSSRSDMEIVPADCADIDILIILCGCLRACADKAEIKAQARQHLIIAGQSLAGTAQNEERLIAMLASEIDRLLPPVK